MFNIYCKCGRCLSVDYQASIESYLKKVDYIRDDLDKICDIALNTYLIYKCIFCGETYKYTFEEVEKLIRESVKQDVKNVRKIHVFKNDVYPGAVDPDNGMEFCGLCAGVDGEGSCYVDVIKQCSYRREI